MNILENLEYEPLNFIPLPRDDVGVYGGDKTMVDTADND